MKKISFALFFCLCALAGFAQNSKPLDLKEIVSGEFIPQNISGVIPIPGDGEHYSQMNADKTQIIKYSFKTGKPVEVLFDAATARECPFKKFDSYNFAPDGSKLLIATETVPVYRHSYTAVHYIYSLKRNLDGKINNVVEKLSDGGPQQVPIFSPDGNQVAFVRDNIGVQSRQQDAGFHPFRRTGSSLLYFPGICRRSASYCPLREIPGRIYL